MIGYAQVNEIALEILEKLISRYPLKRVEITADDADIIFDQIFESLEYHLHPDYYDGN